MRRVDVTDEIRMMPAYDSPPPEELPMFAENRVHQRSSGNPYPNKVVLRVDREHRQERPFRVITLENEYLKIELMPELGGRIYSAYDKRTGYDFFYRQHVIKPALIGMLGSWISGGCEFNWPCHHRPGTFMPADVRIEEHESGAVTVWMSENEPLDRMKGMVGICLAPGEARFDTRVRIYNRTPARHSFLWWENAAVPVHPEYRLVFPPDVTYVQFHYRKNVTGYPEASGVYNGIRMGSGTDISLHGNTRQPTSYFCGSTKYDFFGGYDEKKRCGVIHVADRTVSVGKKMFTWAYSQLSESWEKALTDTDGAYAELMASSYSLNQPDFTWLMPYEGKEFSQLWYPIGGIGAPFCACREAAVAFSGGKLHLQATCLLDGAVLEVDGREISLCAAPDEPFSMPLSAMPEHLTLRSGENRVLMCYTRPEPAPEMPAVIPDNPALNRLHTAQELYLLGVHAEQYRDPAARPEGYWLEALRRDPEYVPALTAMAGRELACFRPGKALDYAMRAWKKATVRNFHPESGQLQYMIGRILEALDRDDEALDWYMQSAWQQDSRSRALTRAAMIEGRRGNPKSMGDLAQKALEEHSRNETALLLLALSRTGSERAEILGRLESYDPLNPTGRFLQPGPVPAFYDSLLSDPCQTALDIAQDLTECGETEAACELLAHLPHPCAQTEYVRRYLSGSNGPRADIPSLGTGIAYPSRPLEYRALHAAVSGNPKDGAAANLLACLLYHTGNSAEACALWEKASGLMPEDYLSLRNRAVACYSHLNRRKEALPLLKQALALRPDDAQLIWETAYVMLRTGRDPSAVAAFLSDKGDPREDIAIEHCRALNLSGRYDEALKILLGRNFTPCEGGEHAVAEQYMFAHHALGREALAAGRAEEALDHFRQAQVLPARLGAGLWNEVLLVPHWYFEAVCLMDLHRGKEAEVPLNRILVLRQDYFTDMHLPEFPCWQAMAEKLRGHDASAREIIAAHLRAQDAADEDIDPGYRRTTPFFISYMEDARALRRAGTDWQRAMARFAAGDLPAAAALAASSLRNDPANLYASLVCRSV